MHMDSYMHSLLIFKDNIFVGASKTTKSMNVLVFEFHTVLYIILIGKIFVTGIKTDL